MGSPAGPTRAFVRDAWISMMATRPWASGQPQRQCDARLGRQHRVTCDEDEAKEIVTEITAPLRNRCRHLLRGPQLASDLLALPLEPRVSAQSVDGAMFGCRHEPGARV